MLQVVQCTVQCSRVSPEPFIVQCSMVNVELCTVQFTRVYSECCTGQCSRVYVVHCSILGFLQETCTIYNTSDTLEHCTVQHSGCMLNGT